MCIRDRSGRPRETQQQKLARIKRELEAVPTEPGVYLWKDAAGEVIYVGKAKQPVSYTHLPRLRR